jgi:hypothetical protein
MPTTGASLIPKLRAVGDDGHELGQKPGLMSIGKR